MYKDQKLAILERLRSLYLKKDTAAIPEKKLLFSFQGLHVDLSYAQLNESIITELINFAQQNDIEVKRDKMFRGEMVNVTEKRAALHMVLREPFSNSFNWTESDFKMDLKITRSKMENFCSLVRSGRLRGVTGKKFTQIVNIGIGGSDLGARMAVRALKDDQDGPTCHFVCNLDCSDILDVLSALNAEETLILVVSKSFKTLETIENAKISIQWLKQKLNRERVTEHLVAITNEPNIATEASFAKERIFKIYDWVGGRYSLWSSVGMPLMLSIGIEKFNEFLAGAHAMDQHFKTAPINKNIPILLGLVDFWHRVICDCRTRAIIPYAQRLDQFVNYLQQLEMESNGKDVDVNGCSLRCPSAPVIWGGVGTNSQHSFFQFLHQGTDITPIEFIVPLKSQYPRFAKQHMRLLANFLAQLKVFCRGCTIDEVRKRISKDKKPFLEDGDRSIFFKLQGKRPCTLLTFPKLNPYFLGVILALYEHRVYVEGCCYNVNSFDQCGVEIGKLISEDLYAFLSGKISECELPSDPLFSSLFSFIKKQQQDSSTFEWFEKI